MTWKDFRPEKSRFPIHLKPGLVKPWGGLTRPFTKAGEKLGEGKELESKEFKNHNMSGGISMWEGVAAKKVGRRMKEDLR